MTPEERQLLQQAHALLGKLLAATPKPERTRQRNNGYSQDFEKWYSVYPRKVGKKAAWNAYQSACKRFMDRPMKRKDGGNPHEFLWDKVQKYAASKLVQAHRMNGTMDKIPHPTTWLNQERYDDDPSEWGYTYGNSPALRGDVSDYL